MGRIDASMVMTALERQVLAMLHRVVFGEGDAFYEEHVERAESTLGIASSGGTLCNLDALWCARNTRLGATGGFEGVDRPGLSSALHHYGYRNAVAVGSEAMHYSFGKAASLLGLGEKGLVRVPCDQRGRMSIADLCRVLEECQAAGSCVLAVIANAGTTDIGAVDPIAEIAAVARDAGIHVHVDAAWGGPVLFSEKHRPRLDGIEQADSVTIDGHKQLYVPVGTGVVSFRDPLAARAIEKEAAYILRPGSMHLGRRSVEGSRPAHALFLHAALHLIGRRGFEYLIDRGIEIAQYMADAVRDRP